MNDLPLPPTECVFYGRLVAIHPNGDGEIEGYSGPQRAVMPARLMNGHRVGSELRYYVRDDHRCAIAQVTRLLR